MGFLLDSVRFDYEYKIAKSVPINRIRSLEGDARGFWAVESRFWRTGEGGGRIVPILKHRF
jgi:hypothetical protein